MHLSTGETLNVSTTIQIGNKTEHRKNLLGNRKQSLQMGPLILSLFRKTICVKKKKKRKPETAFWVCVQESYKKSVPDHKPIMCRNQVLHPSVLLPVIT